MIANLKSCDWNTDSPCKEMCNWEQYEEYAYLYKGVKGMINIFNRIRAQQSSI